LCYRVRRGNDGNSMPHSSRSVFVVAVSQGASITSEWICC
jgi:hypothetical protein